MTLSGYGVQEWQCIKVSFPVFTSETGSGSLKCACSVLRLMSTRKLIMIVTYVRY